MKLKKLGLFSIAAVAALAISIPAFAHDTVKDNAPSCEKQQVSEFFRF